MFINSIINYNLFWFISKPLFKILELFYKYTHNWGVSIIILTFFLRIFTYPLAKLQYISVIKLSLLKSDLDNMRIKYINNKKLQNQKVSSFYKREGINPFIGLILTFIQMPIFFSLYNILTGNFHFISFFFWINDLSSKDPYYILPLLMGLTIFLLQRISFNKSINLIQKRLLILIPILFTLFFLFFPSGLVLYYIISNIIVFIQQKFIFVKLIKIYE